MYEIIADTIKPVSSNKIKMFILQYVQDVLLNSYERKRLINIASKYNFSFSNINNPTNLFYILKNLHEFFQPYYKEEGENNQNITANMDYIYKVLKLKIDCKTFAMINLLLLIENKKLVSDIELIFSGINSIQHVYLSVLINGIQNYIDVDICNKKFNIINSLKQEHNIIQTYQIKI